MKTKILIPTDGSMFSEQIIPCIQRLFEPGDVELVLMRVAEPVYSHSAAQAELVRDTIAYGMSTHHVTDRDMTAAKHPIYATQIEQNVRAEFEAALLPLIRSLRSAGYEATSHIEFGTPAEAIARFIERDGIDLIALTTHGRTGLSRAIFGSVAEAIMSRVTIPVLLLHPA